MNSTSFARTLPYLLALALGCSASPTARDGGGFGGGFDSGPGGAMDAGGPRDGGPPNPLSDAGPRFDGDAGCDVTTPVETQIVGDPPDMLLVVDISASMCTPLIDSFPAMDSKLAIMRDSLSEVTTNYDGRINFGLELFPSDNECGPGTIRNPVMPRNAGAIQTTLNGLTVDIFGCVLAQGGATPTAPSMDVGRTYFESIPPNPIGRYVLLATDGLPNCGEPLPDGGTAETIDETVASIEALRAAGITTYVLGFGTDLTGGGDALMRMAVAGGTSRAYSARSAMELESVLDTIAAEIIPPSCTVELDGPPRNPDLFQVSFDGGPLIPRNPSRSSGWDYDEGTNTITFYGAECTAVQAGDVTSIDVDFGCPGPLI